MIKLVKHNCASCEYYAAFEGVCCNGDNREWVGSCPPNPDGACAYWADKALPKYDPAEFFSAERKRRP